MNRQIPPDELLAELQQLDPRTFELALTRCALRQAEAQLEALNPQPQEGTTDDHEQEHQAPAG
jgi:hypothetical protein